MFRILLGIIGTILLIPVAITLVAILVATLIGGYVAFAVSVCWPFILVGLVVFAVIRIIKRFT